MPADVAPGSLRIARRIVGSFTRALLSADHVIVGEGWGCARFSTRQGGFSWQCWDAPKHSNALGQIPRAWNVPWLDEKWDLQRAAPIDSAGTLRRMNGFAAGRRQSSVTRRHTSS
jgi:hypothetical protein